jgi:carboxyl-terminal processing protease
VVRIKTTLIILFITIITFTSGTGCLMPFSPAPVSTATPVAPGISLGSIDQAWALIQQDYVDKSKIDNSKMSGAAIKAMLETLNDTYTAYMDPETYRLNLSSMEGKFDGIGAVVTEENKTAKVVSVYPDSPAEKASVKAGDVILAVDGRSTEGMSLTEVIVRVRGPRGSSVKLTIQRAGESTPVEITIIRAEIKIITVKSEMKDNISVITISGFSDNTDDELIPVLAALPQQKAMGIVIDLRDNPGGLLQIVVDVASHFLKPGDLVVDVVDNKGEHSSSKAGRSSITTDLPAVVLVGNHSASGSEVLAGALKDYKRATIAGGKTYGKGSVNTLRQLDDGSGIYITIARWLTPKGQMIEGKGIEPDVALELKDNDAVNWAIDYLKSGRKGTVERVPELVYG